MHNTVRWKICLTHTLRRFYVDPAVFFELLPWGNHCLEAILSLRQSLPWGNPSLEAILALRQSLPGGNFCLEAILALRQSLHGGKPCMEAILALRQSLPWGKTGTLKQQGMRSYFFPWSNSTTNYDYKDLTFLTDCSENGNRQQSRAGHSATV